MEQTRNSRITFELRPTRDKIAEIAAAERVLDYTARLGVTSLRLIDLDYGNIRCTTGP
jgi:hypothetical protein